MVMRRCLIFSLRFYCVKTRLIEQFRIFAKVILDCQDSSVVGHFSICDHF